MSDGIFLDPKTIPAGVGLDDGEGRRQLALEAAEIGIWDLDLLSGIWRFDPCARQLHNLPSKTLTNGPDGFAAIVHPDDRAAVRGAFRHAAEASADGRLTIDYRIARHDGTFRWLRAWGKAAFAGQGADRRALRIVGASRDVTAEKEVAEALRILVGERQHRVRNILTVIRSIFTRTLESQSSMEDAVEHFRGRLDALARVQVVLTQRVSGGVDLEEMIRDELLSVGAAPRANLAIEGPQVDLTSTQAESVMLAIHELTTNAIKFGALSGPGAKLRIAWEVETHGDLQRLRLRWIERGVPIPSDPNRRKGFGQQFIEDGLPYRLGGSARLELSERGVDCDIVIPLSADTGETESEGS